MVGECPNDQRLGPQKAPSYARQTGAPPSSLRPGQGQKVASQRLISVASSSLRKKIGLGAVSSPTAIWSASRAPAPRSSLLWKVATAIRPVGSLRARLKPKRRPDPFSRSLFQERSSPSLFLPVVPTKAGIHLLSLLSWGLGEGASTLRECTRVYLVHAAATQEVAVTHLLAWGRADSTGVGAGA